jgi:hypothetical protein
MWTMRTIARDRAAGALLALAVLLASFSLAAAPGAGTAAKENSATADRPLTGRLAGGHHPDASDARDQGQVALPRHGLSPGVTPERRPDRVGHGPDLTAALAAALAAAVLLGIPASWRRRRHSGRGGCPPRGARAPPRLSIA